MSHRLGGTTRFPKHTTATSGSEGADHVATSNLKQPPPYFKSKAKSVSATSLGLGEAPKRIAITEQNRENYTFEPHHQAHAHDQASSLLWTRTTSPVHFVPVAAATAASSSSPENLNDTQAATKLDHPRQPQSLRGKPSVAGRNKSSVKNTALKEKQQQQQQQR